MLRFLSRRISRRIAAIVGVAMAVLGLGGLLLVLDQTFRTQETITERLLGSLGRSVATSFNSFDARTGQHPIVDILADLSDHSDIEAVDVFDAKGRIRWSSDVRHRGRLVGKEVLAVLTSSQAQSSPDRVARAGEVRVVLPLHKTSSCLPCHVKSPDPLGGVAVVARNDQLLGSVVDYTQRAGLLVLLAVVLLTALLLVLLNRVVISRITELVGVMTKAEEGDFLVRAKVSSHDEIGLLASTFNKMLAKITDLRVERIETEREMDEVRDELSLKDELARKSELLEAANTRLEAKLNQLSFLNQLGRDLASRLDLDYLLDLFCRRVTESLNVPELAVLLFDRQRSQIRVIQARGFTTEEDVVGQTFDLESGLSGAAVRNKEAIYVEDLSEDDRGVAYKKGSQAGSLLVVPMIYQDEVIGLLNFSSPSPQAFREDQRDLFTTIAGQAALALANAKLFQETLELSLMDGLTGVLNRRAMDSRLDLEWSRAARDEAALSLVMVDLDHFKVYNDMQGHQLGDETLRRAARIIETNIRKVDAVARYGGEEFVIILPRAGKLEAIEVAKKLRRSIEQADFIRGYLQPLGRVTMSCGVSTAPDDAASVEDLIRRADEALSMAKEAGRNCVRAWGQEVQDSLPTDPAEE